MVTTAQTEHVETLHAVVVTTTTVLSDTPKATKTDRQDETRTEETVVEDMERATIAQTKTGDTEKATA